MLGTDKEDHSTDRRDCAHKTICERRQNRWAHKWQNNATQCGETVGPQCNRRLIKAFVELRHRCDPAAHADWHVTEDKDNDQDNTCASQLDRWKVERHNITDADDRSRDGEA